MIQRRRNRRKKGGGRRNRRGNKNGMRKQMRGVPEKLPYVRNGRDSLIMYKGLIVPDHFYTHLTYAEKGIAILNTSATNTYVYRQNDVYDPNFTGTGSQPVGFDQFMAFYGKFKVHGSHIELKPMQITQLGSVSLSASTSSSSPATVEVAMQSPNSINTSFSSSVLPVGYKLSMYRETRKIIGYPNIFQDDVFVGTASSSPATPLFWVINAATFDNVTNAIFKFDIKITYDVEFFARINLAQSLYEKNKKKGKDSFGTPVDEDLCFKDLEDRESSQDNSQSDINTKIINDFLSHQKGEITLLGKKYKLVEVQS